MTDEPQSPIENATITQAGSFAALLEDDSAPVLFADEFIDSDDDDDDDVVIDDTAARLATLEAALTAREARRVKRKVAAATTGAGASGFLPLALQLLGVYDLDPAVAAMLSTVASLIGAFAAGWVTPERTPALQSATP